MPYFKELFFFCTQALKQRACRVNSHGRQSPCTKVWWVPCFFAIFFFFFLSVHQLELWGFRICVILPMWPFSNWTGCHSPTSGSYSDWRGLWRESADEQAEKAEEGKRAREANNKRRLKKRGNGQKEGEGVEGRGRGGGGGGGLNSWDSMKGAEPATFAPSPPRTGV